MKDWNHQRWSLAGWALLVGGILLGAVRSNAEEFNPRVVLSRPLPAITEFPVKTVREVGDSLNPSELVLGVTVGKESRAYPINMLTGPRREILNDKLGGKAIAGTW